MTPVSAMRFADVLQLRRTKTDEAEERESLALDMVLERK